jgi:hypothetical protein
MSEAIPCDNIDCDSIYNDQPEHLEPPASAELITEDLRCWGVEAYIAGYVNVRHARRFTRRARLSNDSAVPRTTR